MNSMGILYHNGYGVKRDYTKAKEWYEKAIPLGNEYAMYNLGLLYECGNGVKKDISKAEQLYRDAAKLGHEKSKEKLKNLK